MYSDNLRKSKGEFRIHTESLTPLSNFIRVKSSIPEWETSGDHLSKGGFQDWPRSFIPKQDAAVLKDWDIETLVSPLSRWEGVKASMGAGWSFERHVEPCSMYVYSRFLLLRTRPHLSHLDTLTIGACRFSSVQTILYTTEVVWC